MYALPTLLACVAVLRGVLTAEWAYTGSIGPDEWPSHFPACAEERQSPINVFEGDVKFDKGIGQFNYTNYDTPHGLRMALRNNGHSVSISLSGTTPVTIEGGGLPPGQFRAFQLHYHWGEDDAVGSEHQISSVAYPMELHVVHFNTKYLNPSGALKKVDGLAVLAFFFEVTEKDNVNYSGLVNYLPLILEKGREIQVSPQPLTFFLPDTFTKFYRYSGSLTTPSCYESVTWTLFQEPIRISQSQLELFRELVDSHEDPLVNNFRPVQPLNDRQVTSNFEPNVHWSHNEGHAPAENWGMYYSTCSGESQSPINIPTEESRLDPALPEIQYHNYNSVPRKSYKLYNNGHTAGVDISAGGSSVSGGGLPGTYQAARIHFHWGSSDDKGSEHTIDDQAFPMEVHVVHFKKSLIKLSKAVHQPDGLAVFAFFFQITRNDNPALNGLIRSLRAIRNPGSSFAMRPFSLSSILPTNNTNFYRYSGSLTTPGCYESVIWTVFVDTIPISDFQLDAFRQVRSSEKDEDGDKFKMVNNHRPVQDLNQRVVTRNFAVGG